MPKLSRSGLAAAVLVLSSAGGVVVHVARAGSAGPGSAPTSTGSTATISPTSRVDTVAVVAGAEPETPLAELPYAPSLDLASMDRAVDPCGDFYRYACGGWEKTNPIPADQSNWDVYAKLTNDNQRYLWGVLNDLNTPARRAGLTAPQQKIADHFGACMDEDAIERLGATPLAAPLAALDAITDKKDLARFIGQAEADGHTQGLLFSFGASQDYEDSQSVLAFATAGGLGLPDRDYYVQTNAKSVTLRRQYVAHVEKMLVLSGTAPAEARAGAAAAMRLETALARASLTRVAQRNPRNLLHKMPYAGLKKLSPRLDWDTYLGTLGLGADRRPAVVNVTEPAFYRAVDRELARTSLADWKAYLRWHLVNDNTDYLSRAFVEADFAFFGRTLRGTERLKSRWKRCVALVDGQLGDALGQEFVARTFSPEMKARTVEMTRNIEAAMAERLATIPWMGPATRRKALEKLRAIVNKVGYPDRWRDYSSVEIAPGDFFGNVARANRFETRRQLAKIGRPLDRAEWAMTPPTVNAYYDPQLNDINFPAGVLLPPLYDPKMDDAPNYGNTGATIGHELTHGFDDEGRHFDARGNLRNWWTPADDRAFTRQAQCVVDQYGKYVAVDDLRINSRLTQGEDLADLGGTILAYAAWQASIANKRLRPIDGLTPDQRFFVGFAQWACGSVRPEAMREFVLTNPHSPERFRINGVVANMPEFGAAFSCPAKSPLVKAKPCRVW